MHIHVSHYLADGSGSSGGGVVLGLLFIVGLIAAAFYYERFKRNGFRPRTVRTALSADQLRGIFRVQVAGTGWSIVDEGNPIVAQSGLLAGIRQQIGLTITERGDVTECQIMVLRYSRKVLSGRATKAHTLRWRMNAFLNEVRRADVTASVAG